MTVEFNEVDGGTEVVLVHDGFPSEELKSAHEDGWVPCLSHLEAHLG